MSLWKHKNRGTLYELVSELIHLVTFSLEGSIHPVEINGEIIEAELQCSTATKAGAKYAGPVVLYRGTDGRYWLRPKFEFYDGRFEQISISDLGVLND